MQRITKPAVENLTYGGNNSVSDCVRIYTIRSLTTSNDSSDGDFIVSIPRWYLK